jgi:hypothetical protein
MMLGPGVALVALVTVPRGTTYYELNAEIPVGDLVGHPLLNGVTANLHYGYQHFAGAG